MRERSFLFLQPHPSLFGRSVFKEMRGQGANCYIINLSFGDFIYRFGLGATNYFGKVRNWRTYLEAFVEEHQITDIIYYADQRPYHRIARAVAFDKGLQAHAYEFGYYRPDWITLERSGMGVFSHFPDDPDVIRNLASKIKFQEPEGYYPYTFFSEAFNEILYNLIPVFFPVPFIHYRRDRLYHPLVDYPSYIPRLLRSRHKNKLAEQTINKLIGTKEDYFVVPMQMQGDYQVRRCSHYPHLRELVREVVESFAEHSDKKAKLVFKIHPLDNNIEDWNGIINRAAYHYKCVDRVEMIDGGNLNTLLDGCKGIVLVNSTTGLSALQKAIPVKVMGIAVYDIAGLTHQESLDTFWKTPHQPDMELMDDFTKLMKASIQIKGNFFTKAGRKVASKEFARRLLENRVSAHGTFIDPPPRVAKAKKMGVPMTYEV